MVWELGFVGPGYETEAGWVVRVHSCMAWMEVGAWMR